MRTTHLLLAFVLFVSSSVAQSVAETGVTASNQTTAPTQVPDCRIYNPDCNGNGVCQFDGTCRCYNGYFGLLNSNLGGPGDNCPYNVAQLPGVYEKYVYPVRVYQGVIYVLLAILTLYRLILQWFISGTQNNLSVLLIWWILGLVLLHSILNILHCIDYWGMLGRLSYKVMLSTYILTDPMFLLIFSALLFHWAELYYSSIRKMKREEMLKKIKPGYQSNLTIEEIMLKMNFISKFRFAYLALAVVSFGTYIGQCYAQLAGRSLQIRDNYYTFYSVYMIVLWIAFGVGYAIYGLRLIQIMPNGVSSRIKAIMMLIAAFAVFEVTYYCVSYGIFFRKKDVSAINEVYIYSTLHWLSGMCALNIFMPIWEWNKWFNPAVIKSLRSMRTGDSTHSGSGNTRSGFEKSEVMETVDVSLTVVA